jgi:ketosteroid isomerase-like protein
MKLITSLVGIAALSFITSALAQEEETASPASEETPSTTVEETATPTPEAKTTTTPAEQPAAQKKEKPAAPAPVKSASPAIAAPGKKKMSVEATLKDMENKWEASIAAHNASFLESAVASDFVGVSSKGKFINKSGLLSEEFKNNKDTYKSAVNEKLNVKTFGPNVAVVTGRSREKGTGKDGKPFDRTYYYTDTWVIRSGQWQCVASQDMLVPQR